MRGETNGVTIREWDVLARTTTCDDKTTNSAYSFRVRFLTILILAYVLLDEAIDKSHKARGRLRRIYKG